MRGLRVRWAAVSLAILLMSGTLWWVAVSGATEANDGERTDPGVVWPQRMAFVEAADPAQAAAILAGNLFSATRRPPDRSYYPSAGTSTMNSMTPELNDYYDASPFVSEPDVPREPELLLRGIAYNVAMPLATLQIGSEVRRTVTLGIGDSVGSYQVVRITERSVELRGATGSLTIDLPN